MNGNFGEWLDKELIQRGWSQSELARRGGVSPSTVQQAVTGITKPGPRLCQAIARAFGMPAEEVFRLASLLPSVPVVRSRRIIYETDTGDRILELWRRLNPDDQALISALLERLAAVAPRIIGDEP